jgi:hypothetical protein
MWMGLGMAALLGLMVGPRAAEAQSGNRFGAPGVQRPTTSPYLNLLQGKNRAQRLALNYQRTVRPEQEWRRYTSGLNNQVGALQNRVDRAIRPDGSLILPGTGHTTSFMNTGQYFPGMRGR